MSKRAITVTATLVVLIGIVAGTIWRAETRADRLIANLPLIHAGMAKSEVLRLAGEPDAVLRCLEPGTTCKFKYQYSVPLDPAGDDWTVWFDAQELVMGVRREVSQ